MWLDDLTAFLSHPAPGFICRKVGDESKTRVAAVRHVRRPPAAAATLRRCHALHVPSIEQAIEFLERYDGIHLYTPVQQTSNEEWKMAGIEVFPREHWEQRTTELRQQWAEQFDGGDGTAESELPFGRHDFVAIGHPSGSWNYFHWVTRGSNAGRIYWWPWTMPPEKDEFFASSFAEFIAKLYADPATLLNDELGGYTRYFDGNTESQWYPDRYVADIRSLRPNGDPP
jgi:hypothetical protein